MSKIGFKNFISMLPIRHIISAWTLSILAFHSACSQNNQILAPTADNSTKRGKVNSDANDAFGTTETGTKTTEEDTDVDETGAQVEYPRLEFKGIGGISCGGSAPSLVDALSAELSAEQLDVTIDQAQISDAGKAEDQANQEIQSAIGTTTYVRPTASQKKALGDYNLAAYAIFAKTITKQMQHETFTLDKPLPIFPWPAAKARYAALKKAGSETWSAKVKGGGRTFTSNITITYISDNEEADEVTIKFRNEIPEDNANASNYRSIYEIFPVQREAIYTINYVTKDVRRIKSTSWFHGDNCKNAPSSVDLNYKLCKKTTGSNVETHACN